MKLHFFIFAFFAIFIYSNVQSRSKQGVIQLSAESDGLPAENLLINVN